MTDRIVFSPADVDLARSPLRRGIAEPTVVLGAFNPGLARLPSGNLLLMVRIAEALAEPVRDGYARALRWTRAGYVIDAWPAGEADLRDPRFFLVDRGRATVLTSLSWLLPVELDRHGERVVAVHYARAIAPEAAYADRGLEDPRISRVGDRWYMTVCAASAERHCTLLYVSDDAVAWTPLGPVLDHQNKDMLLFEGRVAGAFLALTRPMGESYLAYPPDSPWAAGPSIRLATSPDALHWRPLPAPGIRARRGSASARKVGGGTPPVLTDAGWLTLYHGVDDEGAIGAYRTFWALLDRDDPGIVRHLADDAPLIEADPALIAPFADRAYLPAAVTFSTGMVADGDDWLVAGGEADLACRMTRIPKSRLG